MNIKDYSQSDKYVIIRMLQFIMEADGIIHPNEIECFNKALCAFSISEMDLEEINTYDLSRCTEAISRMPSILKKEAIVLLREMAACDGFIDPRELQIIDAL